jgi:hypothetical protein
MREAYKARHERLWAAGPLGPRKPRPEKLGPYKPKNYDAILSLENGAPRPTLRRIFATVAHIMQVSEDDMRSPNRNHRINLARMAYYYVARQRTLWSYHRIGEIVGNRHHTTVYVGIQRARVFWTSRGLKDWIAKINAEIDRRVNYEVV